MSKKNVEQHQLYTARPKIWKNLRRNNDIPAEFKSKARKIARYNQMAAIPAWLQRTFYNRRINKISLDEQPPIFILGHWRTGTTHLHYMFAEDPRLGYLTNYQCYFFNIAFLTRSWLKPLIAGLFPETRPMDNMSISADKPGEEEQPLSAITTQSGLHSFFFPKNRSYLERYTFFKGISEKEMKQWQRDFMYVVKAITLYNYGKPLVLKNPSNTGRVKALVEMFPNAKFIFPHRNPYDVYRSTVHLYNTIIRSQMMQSYAADEIADTVIYLFREIMKNYVDQKALIPRGNLIEVAFDDLEKEPMATAAHIYNTLKIPGFEKARPKIQSYLDSVKNYERNRFTDLPAEITRRINEEWDFFFQEYDYEKRQPVS